MSTVLNLEARQRALEQRRRSLGIEAENRRERPFVAGADQNPDGREGEAESASTKAPEPIDRTLDAEITKAINDAEKLGKKLGPHYLELLTEDREVLSVSVPRGGIEVAQVYEGRRRCFVHCRVYGGVHAGKTALLAYNEPRRGRQLSRNHNLTMDLKRLLGKIPPPVPSKGHLSRYLGAFFFDCIFRVEMRLVNRVMKSVTDPETGEVKNRWAQTPESEWYSVVDRVLGLESGAPPFLQRREQKKT